jgi:multidrug efflux system outer membrane protein
VIAAAKPTAKPAALLVAALALVLALSGCAAVGPDYARPGLLLPGTYAEAATADANAPLPVDWWKLYGDATLNDLVTAALVQNADIRVAVAKVEEAEAALRETEAGLLPEVDLGGNASRTRSSTLTATPIPANAAVIKNDLKITAATSFELDFWGRLRRTAEASRAQALGTRYAKDVVGLTLAGATAQAYFSLRSLDAQTAVAAQTLTAREESLAVVRSRARGGLASDLELNQAQGAYADAAVQLKELRRQRSVVEHQLGALTGKLDLALAPGDLRNMPLPPLPPAGLPSTLLDRRPDVRQAEQNLVSANAQIGVAKAAQLPTFSLTASFGGQSAAFSNLLKSGAGIWSLGLGALMPVIDSGKYAARTEQAEARQRQSLASYQKAVETAFREVADALTNVQQAADTETDLQARVDAARNALRLARLRYESGYSAYLEVLDAQRTANDAELALVRNRQSRLAYSVDLMKSLGGGWSAEQGAAQR